MFSKVVIILDNRDIPGLPSYVHLFETLCVMSHFGAFKLVFLLTAPDSLQEKTWWKLVRVLDLVSAKGFLSFLDSSPAIAVAAGIFSTLDYDPFFML